MATVGRFADQAVHVTENIADKTVNIGTNAVNTVENVGSSAMDKVSGAIDTTTSKISEVGGNVINQATNFVQDYQKTDDGVQEGETQQPVYSDISQEEVH